MYTMGSICKVTWITWKGHSKKRELAFFENKSAAENFVAGLSKDKKIEGVELKEGLAMKDVC
jgi:hypothetical protein